MEELEELEQLPEALRRFFQYRNPPAPRGGGTGSGFVISSDGYIVTNHHVVDGADTVIVRFSDRREFDAEVIGTDQRSDLALLRVDANELPFLRLGNSENLKVGQWVLAIGSPFGLDYSELNFCAFDRTGPRQIQASLADIIDRGKGCVLT